MNPDVDYTVPKALLGINYSHRDIDGTRESGYNFRETGVMKNPTGAVLFKNVPTELTNYSYNDGDLWQGVAGSVCNRNNVSRYAEVAASFVYGPGTGKTSLTFRMGYDYTEIDWQWLVVLLVTQLPVCMLLNSSVLISRNYSKLHYRLNMAFFNAKREGNDVKLAWQTATESNNLGFQIERRIANGEWQKIGFTACQVIPRK